MSVSCRYKLRGSFLLLGLSVLVVCPWWSGCAAEGPEVSDETAAEVKPVVKVADRGPITLRVTADKDTISIAEKLGLEIEVEATVGIDVQMPDAGLQISDFQIREFTDLPVEEKGDVTVHRQRYMLDSFLSGEYEIPAVTVMYRDSRGEAEDTPADDTDGEADEGLLAELTTEPFTITVTSLLEGEFDPTAFRDVKDVVAVSADRRWAWLFWPAVIVGGAACVVLVVVMVCRRSRRVKPKPVVPPHVWAFNQLQALAQERLVEGGRVQEFYYRLNEIVRAYIELRFGLMAPERTTEEFLKEMRDSEMLAAEYQQALVKFLAACDLVKYACYDPDVSEIEEVFNTARDFIEATRAGAGRSEEAAA